MFAPILLVMLCCTGTATKVQSGKSEEQADTIYRVDAIDSMNSFYIIYAATDKQRYKIVSKKVDINGCIKIKPGKEYRFNLESILAEKIKLGDKEFSSSNSLNVDCFAFEEHTTICKEQSKGIHDLHKTENLVGLCYLAHPN